MTQLYATWLTTCNMTQLYVTWLTTCNMTQLYATWLGHNNFTQVFRVCDTTRSYVTHVTWLVPTCDGTNACVWQGLCSNLTIYTHICLQEPPGDMYLDMWVMSFMNVPHERVMWGTSCMNGHVQCVRGMSRTNESCPMWRSHVTQ